MSIYHKVKCTKEEAQQFKLAVKEWLIKNNFSSLKLRAYTSYDGEVRVYFGKTLSPSPLRRSRKVVPGNLYILDYSPRKLVANYYPLIRVEWNEEERDELKHWLSSTAKLLNYDTNLDI